MTFIDVPRTRLDAHCPESTGTTDSEHDFLFNTNGLVAAIKMVSDGTILLGIFIKISVQQIDSDIADTRFPYLNCYAAPR